MRSLVKSGRLDRFITVEQPIETKSATGAPTISWSTYAQVWAERVDPVGREFFEAAADQVEITAKYRLHWLDGVTPDMRVTEEGTVYEIVAVVEPVRRRETLLMVRRVV